MIRGSRPRFRCHGIVAALSVLTLLAPAAAAQSPDSTGRLTGGGATVSGVVRDSIARLPLAGAIVQLVSADRTPRFSRSAISDSLGRYSVPDVPAGRFMLGFFHAILDSLGLEPTLREVEVVGTHPVRADLGIPSPSRLRDAICGPRTPDNRGAIVVGVVRSARDGAPSAGAEVIGEWVEYAFRSDGLVRHHPRLVATTEANGWFALCNVPGAGTLSIGASRGADSTDLIEVTVPVDGFLRRELYLGASRTVVRDGGAGADTVPPSHRRLGDGQLRGTVFSADGQAVAGAVVSMPDGPQARTNDRGEWTLVEVPSGTRTLEVRAISFYPHRRAVDVVAGAAPVRVALMTFRAVLDTVRVTAARLADRGSGFEHRRLNSGLGRFLTREDIARRAVLATSDLFRTVAGMRVESLILMRSAFGDCSPSLYLDGNLVPTLADGLTAIDIDAWVRPREIAGIEIYFDQVPAQFQLGPTGCGAIVIWTKR